MGVEDTPFFGSPGFTCGDAGGVLTSVADDPYKKRTLEVKNNLRKIHSSFRYPEGASRQAMVLLIKV